MIKIKGVKIEMQVQGLLKDVLSIPKQESFAEYIVVC